MSLVVQPGDVVLVRGRGPVAWGIRLFSWGWWRGEDWPRWNHVGLIDGPLPDLVNSLPHVIESTWPKVRRRPLAAVQADAIEVQVWRCCRLGEIQRGVVVRAARDYLGRRYPWWHCVAHAADGLLGGAYLFRRLIGQGQYGICSWLVAYSLWKVGVSFLGKRPEYVQPDCISDHVEASPDWARVSLSPD